MPPIHYYRAATRLGAVRLENSTIIYVAPVRPQKDPAAFIHHVPRPDGATIVNGQRIYITARRLQFGGRRLDLSLVIDSGPLPRVGFISSHDRNALGARLSEDDLRT